MWSESHWVKPEPGVYYLDAFHTQEKWDDEKGQASFYRTTYGSECNTTKTYGAWFGSTQRNYWRPQLTSSHRRKSFSVTLYIYILNLYIHSTILTSFHSDLKSHLSIYWLIVDNILMVSLYNFKAIRRK